MSACRSHRLLDLLLHAAVGLVVMGYARCAQAYMLKTTASGAPVRWHSSVVTMYLDEKLDELFGTTDARAALHDIASVLAHELGHVLGLAESHTDERATMWPYIGEGEVHQRTLSTDDEEGVIAAYRQGAVDQPLGSCAQASVLGRVQGGSRPWLPALVLLVAGVRHLRRRVPRQGRARGATPDATRPASPTF